MPFYLMVIVVVAEKWVKAALGVGQAVASAEAMA
jgi:hypothetical protein